MDLFDRAKSFLVHCASSPQIPVVLLLLWQLSLPPWLKWPLLALVAFDLGVHAAAYQPKIRNGHRWKVVIVGAGFSGLGAAKKLLEVGISDILILEKASRLGGTWHENRYPGIACDVPSHLYSFSYYLNPWWSRLYSEGREIWSYMDRFAGDFGLRRLIRFNTKVASCSWDDRTQLWTVETEQGQTYKANFVVQGTGPLSVPNYPEFKNREAFHGLVLHSAEWEETLDVRGKKVGVIGTGASAVQIVPAIADEVAELHVFQRTPPWVPDRYVGAKAIVDQDMNLWYFRRDGEYTTLWKVIFYLFPVLNTLVRYFHFWLREAMFHVAFKIRPWTVAMAKRFIRSMMLKRADNDEILCSKLTPDYYVGCKRITPSDGYIQAYLKSNVHLVCDPIESFTSKGIRTKDGKERDLDVVILATGFSLLSAARVLDTKGKGKQSMREMWDDCPRNYYGITYPGFPNYFFMLGPNTGLGHNSIIFMIECQVNYLLDCIRTVSNKGQNALDLRKSTLDRYVSWVDSGIRELVFGASNCSAWYVNKHGVNWTLWHKDLTSYWWGTFKCREKDYTFE